MTLLQHHHIASKLLDFVHYTHAANSIVAIMPETRRYIPPHKRRRLALLANEPGKPSFMGLAVETRLQIYGYLLTPTPSAHAHRLKTVAYMSSDLADDFHCCVRTYVTQKDEAQPQTTPRLTCQCDGGDRYPAILATCKQIFNEAIPVLYENMELRIPIWSDKRESFFEEIQKVFEAMPEYAPKLIRRAALVGSVRTCRSIYRPEGSRFITSYMRSYCERLNAQLPTLREVRLQLRMDGLNRVDLLTHNADGRTFGSIASILGLRRVMIRVCDATMCGRNVMHSFTLRDDAGLVRAVMVSAIEAKAEAMGKQLEVVEEVEHHTSFP